MTRSISAMGNAALVATGVGSFGRSALATIPRQISSRNISNTPHALNKLSSLDDAGTA